MTARPIARRAALGVILSLSLASTLSACVFGTAGQGPVVAGPRDVDAFTRVEIGSGLRATLTVGSPVSVEVKAQQNLQSLIATDVSGDTLSVRLTDDLSTHEPVDVLVTLPDLRGVVLHGGSAVWAVGTTDHLDVRVSGGARASLEGLVARSVELDVAGGGVAIVNATDVVNGSVSGGANATILGPARIEVDASGGASVGRG